MVVLSQLLVIDYRHILNFLSLLYAILLYVQNSFDVGVLCYIWLGTGGGLRSLLDLRYPSRPGLHSSRDGNLGKMIKSCHVQNQSNHIDTFINIYRISG